MAKVATHARPRAGSGLWGYSWTNKWWQILQKQTAACHSGGIKSSGGSETSSYRVSRTVLAYLPAIKSHIQQGFRAQLSEQAHPS